MTAVSPFVLNNAASQLDRRLGAPDPERIAVDGRSLAQLIAFASQYGALISFYDLDNRVAGNWEAFFAHDASVAEALHAALDLTDIEQGVSALLREMRLAHEGNQRLEALLRLLAMLARLLGILDRAQAPTDDPQAQIARFASRDKDDTVAAPLEKLLRHIGHGSLVDRLAAAMERSSWFDTICDIVEDLVTALIGELQAGVDAAKAGLDASLKAAGHQPPAAIYNAFALLFVEARKVLNEFPRRLMNFYYGDVLDQHMLPPVPDKLFLAFTRATGAEQASVPRGALFPAGNDPQGQAINYAADTALEVTPASVKGISLHRITYMQTEARAIPSSVLRGTVDVDPQQPVAPTPFPMFGLAQAGSAGALTMEAAQIGFCVGSPLLLLTGGTRTVEVSLTVSPATARAAVDMHPEVNAETQAIDLIAQAIQVNLALYYSTAGGWVPIQAFTVEASLLLGTNATLFTIAFTIPPDAPPIGPVDTKPPPSAPPPPLPENAFPSQPGEPLVVASLALDQTEQPYAYALLSLIKIAGITLDVQVEALDALTLTTPNGPADTSQNFAPFGLPPAQGSALDIQAVELFSKPIDTLSLRINWAGLPITSGGFAGYYRNYAIDADGEIATAPLFDNTSFRIATDVVNPGFWNRSSNEQPYLFQTTAPQPTPSASTAIVTPDPEGTVAPTTVLTVPGVAPTSPPPYYNPAASALRLTLTEPSYAFGNLLYQNNLMYAARKAVPLPSGRAASPPPTSATPPALPNPPWLPMVSSLTLDYSASASQALDSTPAPSGSSGVYLNFWHLGPFDLLQPAIASGDATGINLLPDPGAQAALYIELSAPVSQVALLFILAAGPDGWWKQPPKMIWEERVGKHWRHCTVLSDTTGGLSNSGIVTLAPKVPQGASKAPMLRVRSIGSTQNAPIVQSVIANALTASWHGPGGATELGTPLPAQTITKSASQLAGIASIGQPMQSFGGVPPAVGPDFTKWLAERLRHKSFAIDGWDYARLALQAAPSLWQVAVVPAVDERTGMRAPGKVWVIVVAGPTTPNVVDATVPQADLATLSEVGDLLTARASPFAEIVVTNPPYLRLTVHAELDFSEDNTSAYWIGQLQSELIAWLSPWPDPAIGLRPHDYYSRRAIAEFIRNRPYVQGITRLHVLPEPSGSASVHTYHYFTSALSHELEQAPRSPGASRYAAEAEQARP